MIKRYSGPRGQILLLDHESNILRGNPLQDPYRRKVGVYLPHEYEKRSKRYPIMMDLAGFTGSGLSHLGWKSFQENIPEMLDRLIHEKKMGPVIAVFPDCFTSLGGNQYINSSAIGEYEDYLIDEILPFIETNFRVLSGRKHRAVFGKSSGGYGAIIHGMKRPDAWNAIACHSGDMYFDFCYRAFFPEALNHLAKYKSSIPDFLKYFSQEKKPSEADVHTLMAIAMAASYDPDPQTKLGFHWPLDMKTGELNESRWKKWLRHDPVCMDKKYCLNLKKLALVFIDCGSKDQYHLQYGGRMMSKRLKSLGVRHMYEEFPDNHSSIDYRLNRSLPLLYKKIC